MSIPKAPHFLLNQLLYLMLIVFLILNISAEMVHYFVFQSFDKALTRTNILLDEDRQKTQENAKYVLLGYEYDTLVQCSAQTSQIIKGFMDYIDSVRLDFDKVVAAQPRFLNDRVISHDYFLKGDTPRATLIKARIVATHQQLIGAVDSIGAYVRGKGGNAAEELKMTKQWLRLKVSENDWEAEDQPNWETSMFGDLPISACYTMLTKLQNDARTDETMLVNYLSSKVTYCGGSFYKIEPMSVPQKQYVVSGERFSTEIFFAITYPRRTNIACFVDSIALPVRNRKGLFEIRTKEVGEKSYTIEITAPKPFDTLPQKWTKTFKYEVIQPSIDCAADQMKVFYMGMNNPISVHAAGIPSEKLQVSGTNCVLQPNGAGKFRVTVAKEGLAHINITGNGWHQSFPFRVKSLPTPIPTLGLQKSGKMAIHTMQTQSKIELETNDLEIPYEIKQFTLVRVSQTDRARSTPIVVKSGIFDANALHLVSKAQAGDWYCFDEIQVINPFDKQVRTIINMNFLVF